MLPSPAALLPVILYRITRAMRPCSGARKRFAAIIWSVCRQTMSYWAANQPNLPTKRLRAPAEGSACTRRTTCLHRRGKRLTPSTSGPKSGSRKPLACLPDVAGRFDIRASLTCRHDQFIGQLSANHGRAPIPILNMPFPSARHQSRLAPPCNTEPITFEISEFEISAILSFTLHGFARKVLRSRGTRAPTVIEGKVVLPGDALQLKVITAYRQNRVCCAEVHRLSRVASECRPNTSSRHRLRQGCLGAFEIFHSASSM